MIFEDVLVIKNGRNQKAVENPQGKYPIYGSGGIMGYADDYICNADTVVIGRKGSINNPLFVKEPFWNVDTAFGLEADRNVLLPKYLFYFCSHFDFERLNKAVTIPSLTKSDLLKIEIDVPDLRIQQSIVERLSSIESIIQLRKQQLTELDTLVKARFVEMFGTYAETTKLSDVATVSGGLTKNANRDKLPLRMPYLRVANVFFASVDVSEMLEIGLTEEEYKKTVLHYEDLLFVEGNGSPDQIGRVAIWRNEIEPCVHQNHLIKARFNKGQVIPTFAMYYFMSTMGREQIKVKAVSTSGLYTLSVSKISDLKLPDPPLELQNRFAAFVEQTDKSKLSIQASLDQLETLKQSLMQKYFG